ncbi:MAG: hypothetical protein BRD27_04465, partial [Bacteroidetes bacterium QH_10_64_19]
MSMMHRASCWRPLGLSLFLATLALGSGAAMAQQAPDPTTRVSRPTPDRLDTLRAYIDRTWGPLTRSHDDLLEALPDDKIDHEPGTPWPLYVAASEDTTQ